MSQHKVSLALGFLDTQPKAAAKIIELQSPQDAADFLASIPAAKAALIVAKMLPQYAAQLCLRMPKEVILSILIKMDAKVLVNILRQLSSPQRDPLLKELPAKTQVACALILNYSDTMAGAWMTSQVLTIPVEATIPEAQHRIQGASLPIIGDSIFIVDREQMLKGRVLLQDLLHAADAMPITSISKVELSSLNGRMSINEVATSPIWEINDTVPVLNRKNEFIGVLRHADLRQAMLALREPSPQRGEAPDLLTGISQGYGQTLLALFQSMQEFVQSELHPNQHTR